MIKQGMNLTREQRGELISETEVKGQTDEKKHEQKQEEVKSLEVSFLEIVFNIFGIYNIVFVFIPSGGVSHGIL